MSYNNIFSTTLLDKFCEKTESAKVSFTQFKSCDHTLGKLYYFATFWIHGTTVHGMKYVSI